MLASIMLSLPGIVHSGNITVWSMTVPPPQKLCLWSQASSQARPVAVFRQAYPQTLGVLCLGPEGFTSVRVTKTSKDSVWVMRLDPGRSNVWTLNVLDEGWDVPQIGYTYNCRKGETLVAAIWQKSALTPDDDATTQGGLICSSAKGVAWRDHTDLAPMHFPSYYALPR